MTISFSEGWQAGLLLGCAITVIVEAIGRAILFWRRHRNHAHCERCEGCLAADGHAVARIERLLVCPVCHDTRPAQFLQEGDLFVESVALVPVPDELGALESP